MTQRTYSELTALLADNNTGDISPQDLRDFLESSLAPHGSLYMASPVETVINTQGVYEKVNGVTAATADSYLITADTAGRLTYTGASPRHFHLVASVSMTCESNNQILSFRMALNGVTMPESQLRRKVGTGTDIGSTALHADAMLSQGDYLELYVANNTSAANVTIQDLYMFAMGMMM